MPCASRRGRYLFRGRIPGGTRSAFSRTGYPHLGRSQQPVPETIAGPDHLRHPPVRGAWLRVVVERLVARWIERLARRAEALDAKFAERLR